MANYQGYSTLEVNRPHEAPEVYDPDQNQKEALAAEYGTPGIHFPEAVQNQHTSSYGAPSHPSSARGDGRYDYPQYGEGLEAVPPHDEAVPKRRICGLAARNFYILLAVAIVIVVGAVGGGVGGALASKGGNSQPLGGSTGTTNGTDSPGNGTSTTPKGPRPLGITKIAAANFTDSNNISHRHVYFQDEFNSIIERRWKSDTNQWTTNNISKLFEASTTYNPQYGTSLTVAARAKYDSFEPEIQLYFLDQFNFIRSVHAFDAETKPDDWTNNTLGGAFLEVRKGSHLSAMYQSWWDDTRSGSWCVAYQRPSDGSVKTANSSHWVTSDVAVKGTDLSNNASLALIPSLTNGRLSGAWLASSGVVQSSQQAPLQVSGFVDTWDNVVPRPMLLADLPSEQNQFAATQVDNWRSPLFVSLADDGTLESPSGDDATDKIALVDAPEGTRFRAISFTHDVHFYGISGDEIQEYELIQDRPATLKYLGRIWPVE
ncbi:serine/threonine kinase PknH [Microdochium nivale]|nr:serine/threonine kinase PknH [Microdochium nivale]